MGDEKKDDAPAPDTSIDDVANEKEQAQEEEKAADSFINDIYTSEGKQEPTDDVDEGEGVDSKKEQEETKESNNEDVEGEKGIFKLKKDLETEDQGSGSDEEASPIEIIGEIKDQGKSEEKG